MGTSIVLDPSKEECPNDKSLPCRNDNRFHCYCWYEQDQPCCACGTTDLNLLVIEG